MKLFPEKTIMNRTMTTALQVFVLMLSACGSSGSGNNGAQPTAAVLTLATSQTSTTIYGIKATVVLPSGVAVKSAVEPPQTDDGVVTAAGVTAGSYVLGVYSAATSTLPGTVTVDLANEDGFGIGEFVIVNCDIDSGHHPTAHSFSIANLTAWNSNGAEIEDVLSEISVDIN